jgi:hypothetical protein
VLQVAVGTSWMCKTRVKSRNGGEAYASSAICTVEAMDHNRPNEAFVRWFFRKINLPEMSTDIDVDGKTVFRKAGPHHQAKIKIRKVQVGANTERRQQGLEDKNHNISVDEVFPRAENGVEEWVVASNELSRLNMATVEKTPCQVTFHRAPTPNYTSNKTGGGIRHYQYKHQVDGLMAKGGDSGGCIQLVTMSDAQVLEMAGTMFRTNPWILDMIMSASVKPLLFGFWVKEVRSKCWAPMEMNGPELRIKNLPFGAWAGMSLTAGCTSAYCDGAKAWTCNFANIEILAECLDTIIFATAQGPHHVIWVQMVWEMGTSDTVFKVFRRIDTLEVGA